VLTHPALSWAIVGVKKLEHIETIVAAANATLPNQDWHKLAGVMAKAKKDAEALAKSS
jgi:predicted oxidoreductase